MRVRRLIADDDRTAATCLLQRFFREEGFSTADTDIAANLRRMLTLEHCAVLVAETGSETVGVATVSMDFGIEYGWSAELGDLYVLPQWRNKGIARRLIAEAETFLRSMDAGGYQVTVTPHAKDAGLRQFYRALGFEDEGRLLLYRKL